METVVIAVACIAPAAITLAAALHAIRAVGQLFARLG